MKALITGASSGIGADIARILSDKGYDLIIVARNKKKLEKIKKELKTNVTVIDLDISTTYNCHELYSLVKNENIDILINNAGFGVFGEFSDTKLDKELDMIDLNVKTVHTLTKLFIKDFIKKDNGYILNVASSAAFLPGPMMASYYASKAYVLRLTEAIHEELRKKNSNVYIGALCPGPVDTNFNNVAGVKFGVKAMDSYTVSKYAVKKMFERKMVIIPGFIMRLLTTFNKIIPTSILLKFAYNIQKKKEK